MSNENEKKLEGEVKVTIQIGVVDYMHILSVNKVLNGFFGDTFEDFINYWLREKCNPRYYMSNEEFKKHEERFHSIKLKLPSINTIIIAGVCDIYINRTINIPLYNFYLLSLYVGLSWNNKITIEEYITDSIVYGIATTNIIDLIVGEYEYYITTPNEIDTYFDFLKAEVHKFGVEVFKQKS